MRMRITSSNGLYAGGLDMEPLSAYLPAMAVELASRIKMLRQSRGLNQSEFSDVMGVTQATVSRWERGAMPEAKHLRAIAELAGLTMEEFLGSKDIPIGDSGEPLPVVGYVGAGAAVYPIDDNAHGQGFATVERPPFVKGEAVAVEVRGDSLIPVAEDGWRLVYVGEQTIIEEDVLNRLCVVALTDGRILVKRLIRGSDPQRYHLVSTNAPMIENAEILWAAKVRAIIPA